MSQILKTTSDNSHTVYSEKYSAFYHSTFGALQESQHIFIDYGLKNIQKKNIKIFELGFGTGLNAILSLKYAVGNKINISYTSVELHPVELGLIKNLNYPKLIGINEKSFIEMHRTPWGKCIEINDFFSLHKIQQDFIEYEFKDNFDIIFFDAFAPEVQEHLWTKEIFMKIYESLNSNGILMTYSAKGIVKQALRDAGFEVKRLKGPIGKRHIVKATKLKK